MNNIYQLQYEKAEAEKENKRKAAAWGSLARPGAETATALTPTPKRPKTYWVER